MPKIIRREFFQQPAQLQQPLIDRLYRARGFEPCEQPYDLARLESPENLKGLDKAVGVLADAVTQGQYIVVVGDYDADGATSTALCVLVLQALGAARVSFYVPDRFREGYGLSPEVVNSCLRLKPDLLMTVDNGISSVEGVRSAQRAGMKVIITDHHLAGAELPEADATVNPNQPGCDFPWKSTAGVGVAFYVMAGLRRELQKRGWFDEAGRKAPRLSEWLDLVALGTVADVVPLEYNNRVIVAQGLKRIRSGNCRPGIRALVDIAGRDLKRVSSADLGFALGPRLNAAGRLDDISIGIHCLITSDELEARRLAEQLDALNRSRRELEQTMREEAEQIVQRLQRRGQPLGPALCLYEKGWHEGVVGLVASRIKEAYHRPVLAFAASEDGRIKGSGRSIPGFHLRDALEAVATANPGLIDKYGGHAMAAGLSLAAENLEPFRQAFMEFATRNVDDSMLQQTLLTDGPLNPDELSLDSAWKIMNAGPWGQQFPEPVFEGCFRVVDTRILGGKHLKMRVRDPHSGRDMDAIAFGQTGPENLLPGAEVQLVFRLDANEYRQVTRLQLVVDHLSLTASPR